MFQVQRLPKDPMDPMKPSFAVVRTFGEITPLLVRTFEKRDSAVEFAEFSNRQERKCD